MSKENTVTVEATTKVEEPKQKKKTTKKSPKTTKKPSPKLSLDVADRIIVKRN